LAIKATILLDSTRVPLWVHESIKAISSEETICIHLILINKAEKKSSLNRSCSFFYKILRRIDRFIFKKNSDPFRRVQLPEIPQARIVEVFPIQSKFSDRFPTDIIDVIRTEKTDIILRFGFRILRGDILTASKFGVLSLHHGSTKSYRGGPPAFWELVNKEPITTVTIQRLNEQLDGGDIIKEAHLRTDLNSFFRNQAKLYWAGKELLLGTIKEIIDEGPEHYFRRIIMNSNKSLFYSAPLFQKPTSKSAIIILLGWVARNFLRKLQSIFFLNQWQMQFSVKDGFETVFYRYKKLIPPSDRIWADPFIVFHNNVYNIFFEEKYNKQSRGHISNIQIDEKGNLLTNSEVVLQEEYHLSYPFVFSYDNQHYMLPESAEISELYLYLSHDFPKGWKKHKLLLSGFKTYDPTLHFHNGFWYLFCTVKSDDNHS